MKPINKNRIPCKTRMFSSDSCMVYGFSKLLPLSKAKKASEIVPVGGGPNFKSIDIFLSHLISYFLKKTIMFP